MTSHDEYRYKMYAVMFPHTVSLTAIVNANRDAERAVVL